MVSPHANAAAGPGLSQPGDAKQIFGRLFMSWSHYILPAT